MEPEAQQTLEKPPEIGDGWYVEVHTVEVLPPPTPESTPRPKRDLFPPPVPLKLTIDEASFLYEKLKRVVEKMPEPSKGFSKKTVITCTRYMLEKLEERLDRLSALTPTSGSGRKLRFHDRIIVINVQRHVRAYYMQILKNREIDELRRQNREAKRSTVLEVAEAAEEGPGEDAQPEGPRKPFFRSTHHENPDAQFRGTMLKEALDELPGKLKMSAEEVHALLGVLTETDGNVSEAARHLGQPQRKTARRIERMIRHLKSRGFKA